MKSLKNFLLRRTNSANEIIFIVEFERAANIKKIAVYHFLISLLVPEL